MSVNSHHFHPRTNLKRIPFRGRSGFESDLVEAPTTSPEGQEEGDTKRTSCLASVGRAEIICWITLPDTGFPSCVDGVGRYMLGSILGSILGRVKGVSNSTNRKRRWIFSLGGGGCKWVGGSFRSPHFAFGVRMRTLHARLRMLGGASVICGSRERYDTFVCSVKISSHTASVLRTSTLLLYYLYSTAC